MRLRNRRRYRISAELGAEARCSKCGDWWPADDEFFYRQSDGQPHSWCKACYQADRRSKRQAGANRAPTREPKHEQEIRNSPQS